MLLRIFSYRNQIFPVQKIKQVSKTKMMYYDLLLSQGCREAPSGGGGGGGGRALRGGHPSGTQRQ